MTADDLNALKRARPFLPFEIHDGAGRTHTVTHPELLSISPDATLAVVLSYPARVAVIDIGNIASTTFEGIRRGPIGPDDPAEV